MNRPVSQIRCGNRIIQQKQDILSLQKHYQSLRKARPMTGNTIDKSCVTINNKKRQMVMQNRFTEIERQNRILFQKITSIMHKGQITQTINSTDRSTSVMNKTLNGVYRKRQLQNIEYENAKMLKRLKQKKSSYGAQQLHREWIKKKKVIKNMSLYPYILNNNAKQSREMQLTLARDNQFTTEKSSELQKFKQMRRVRNIDGYMFLITIKFQANKLFIIGDIRELESVKVIELQKSEAQEFIAEQCNGNIQSIFGMLRFDYKSGDLFLVGRDFGGGEIELKDSDMDLRRKVVSQHQAIQKRTLTTGIKNLPPRPLSKELTKRTKINSSYRENNEEDAPIFSISSRKNLINMKSINKSQNNFIRNSFTQENRQSNDQPFESEKQQQVGKEISEKNENEPQWVKILTKENEEPSICNQNESNPIIVNEINLNPTNQSLQQNSVEEREEREEKQKVDKNIENQGTIKQLEPSQNKINIQRQQEVKQV